MSNQGGQRFKHENYTALRKCQIDFPMSLSLVNNTVYIGDNSMLKMEYYSSQATPSKL